MAIQTEGLMVVAGVLVLARAVFTGAEVVHDAVAAPPIEAKAYAPKIVEAGETAMIRWDIVKRTECPGKNSRVWNGENGFHLVETRGATTLPATDHMRTYRISTKVPSYAPPGQLSLTIEGHYRCPAGDVEYFTLGPVQMEVREKQ